MIWLDCCIDVSHNNGAVDWPNVDASIALVFIKATQGSSFVDPRFAENKAGAAARGIMVVPYHFLDASDPSTQVDHFAQFIGAGQPYALDWEGRASQTASAQDAEHIGTALTARCGRAPVGYWVIPGSSPADPTPVMSGWMRWVPRYPIAQARDLSNIPAAKLSLVSAPFWQYTAWGRVAGVAGDVDRSAWYGSPGELKAWYEASLAPVAPVPPPTPSDPIAAILAASDFRAAVKAFQLSNGLDDDGRIGPNTLRVIGERMRE